MTRNCGLVAVALAALVASPVLAGCLGSAQASAMEQKDTADDRAQEWDGEAQLSGIVGLEGNASSWSHAAGHYSGGSDATYWDPNREDDSPGDGQVAVWVYTYVSPNEPGEQFTVVVRDGEVQETGVDDSDDEALPDFSVDSDEAAEIARENNQGIAEGQDSDNYGFVYNLDVNGTGVPVWFVGGGGGGDDGGGGGIVVIDARNGDVISSHGGFGSGSSDWDYGG